MVDIEMPTYILIEFWEDENRREEMFEGMTEFI